MVKSNDEDNNEDNNDDHNNDDHIMMMIETTILLMIIRMTIMMGQIQERRDIVRIGVKQEIWANPDMVLCI